MAVRKLDYSGVQITFGIQPSTPVVTAPAKTLILVGPCYYVVDVFDATGAFDSNALLSGPASLIGEEPPQNTGNKNASGQIVVNGVSTTVSFLSGTWSIGQIVAKLLEAVKGISVFVEANKLGLKTKKTGPSASLRIVGDGLAQFLGFTGKTSAYGYGTYTGQIIEVPFSTLPDPKKILDRCVLKEDSIDIYANVAGMPFHFSEDSAFERNSYYRPVSKKAFVGGVGVDVGHTSPYVWNDVALRPWEPSGGIVSKFWAPGTDSVGFIPASPNDHQNYLIAQAKGVLDKVGGSFKNTAIGDYHGVKGNDIKFQVSVQASGNDVAPIGITVNGTIIGIAINSDKKPTLSDLADAINQDPNASQLVEVALGKGSNGSTEVTNWNNESIYLGGGIDPLTFAGTDADTPQGQGFVVRGDRTSYSMEKGDYIELSVNGGIKTKITFKANDTLDAIKAAINAAIPNLALEDSNTLVLVSPPNSNIYGFKSNLTIHSSNCIPRLFIKDVQSNISTEVETTSIYVRVKADSLPSGIVEGDKIRVTGDDAKIATVHRIASETVNGVAYLNLFLDAPTNYFLPENGIPKQIDVISQLSVNDYLGHKHHGAPYRIEPGDRIWSGGTARTSVISSDNSVVTVNGKQTFPYAALEVTDAYSVSQVFPSWYIEARGCKGADVSSRPLPSMKVDKTENLVTLFGDAIVDGYGRSPVNPSYQLYAGYSALRQDVSPKYITDRIKISGTEELLDKLAPIDPFKNPLGYAAYLAMIASGGLYEFYVLGVPSDDIAGYLECLPTLKKYPDWCIIPLTADDTISRVIGSFVTTMAEPINRREVVTFLTSDIPKESYPATLGSGTKCLSNEKGNETIMIFDPSLFSLASVLTAAGIDPETLTADDNVYLQILEGGASQEEELRRYLISSVNTNQNVATLKINFGPGENQDAFYSSELPPVVSEAGVTLFQRGQPIGDHDIDKQLEALQAKSESYNSRRICLVPNNGVDVDYNGVATRVPNYYATAAIGGYLLAHRVEFPLSGYVIPGLLHVYGTDDRFPQLDRVTGLFFLQNGLANNTVEVCRQFTTNTTDVKYSEFSITSQLDSLALRVRSALRSWRAKNTGAGTLGEQNFLVSAACEAAVTAREIKTARIRDLANHPTLINVHNIILEAEPFVPIGGVFVYIVA